MSALGPRKGAPSSATTTSSSSSQSASGSSSSSAGSEWTRALDGVVSSFATQLKRRELLSTTAVSIKAAELLLTVCRNGRFNTTQALVDQVKRIGHTLTEAHPMQLCIGNVVRRVLYIIRQESAAVLREETLQRSVSVNSDLHDTTGSRTASPPATPTPQAGGDAPSLFAAAAAAQQQQEAVAAAGDPPQQQQQSIDLSLSLHAMLDADTSGSRRNERDLRRTLRPQVRAAIIDEITELIDEIKTVYTHVADQARDHIHSDEVVLTFGYSKTALAFFKAAFKIRGKFQVIVAETAPSYEGQRMAASLAQAGIDTTVIADSAVYAMMSVVNKVIIGTHAVLANGGLVSHAGAHNIAVAARAHSVPVVVVCGLYKLCPLYAFDQDTFNEQAAPVQLLAFERDHHCLDNVTVENAAFEYISPEFVELFVTNYGGHNPSYIYRLLAEYYDPSDYDLSMIAEEH